MRAYRIITAVVLLCLVFSHALNAQKKDKKELSASFIASKQENTIYLSEYLINELNEEEICSVIAHELGHYINKDLYYEIVFSTIHIILNGILHSLLRQ